ncbi:Crp/Fnr family transcriptional regulator [Allopusillimonas soli]|uniref:Crp/Fnr family transcriptional regulator n=1 Tax=Allopusillimonas soli TaxID=659016 RepID=A0A853F8E9_9BURK|nr:Crp/Fnr family transcriptional regulator [Allopusillimonas soli]NYT36229.1 Crp/Fnr family transcriptional regulator [Allopusillimonas soli]
MQRSAAYRSPGPARGHSHTACQPATQTDQQALISRLASLPAFRKANHHALRLLATDARLIRLRARQHLFHMGDTAAYFYLVHMGSIVLYRPCYNGDNKIFHTTMPGDLLAETTMFVAPCKYPLSAQASLCSAVYRLHREHLLDAVRASPDLCYSMLEGMASRISQSLNRIDLLTISGSAQRMVTYFLNIYMRQRSKSLVLPHKQNVLARQLNIAPETFSRQLNAFKRAGLIDGRNRNLALLDIEGLCRAVDLPPPRYPATADANNALSGSSSIPGYAFSSCLGEMSI